MTIIERIAEEIEEKIQKPRRVKLLEPLLFCGCHPQVKKDMHKRAMRLGLNPTYSSKNPTIKVELKNNKKIETDRYKTISMDYEHFEFICRYLES